MKASLSSLVKSESPIVITSGPRCVFCKKSRGCNVKNSNGHLAGIIVIIKHRLALSESSIKGWGVMEKNTDNPVDIPVPRDLEARFGVRIQRGLTPEDLFKAQLSFSCPSGSQYSKASSSFSFFRFRSHKIRSLWPCGGLLSGRVHAFYVKFHIQPTCTFSIHAHSTDAHKFTWKLE